MLIAFIDRDYVYRFANAAYQDWFFRPAAEIVGQDVRVLLGQLRFQQSEGPQPVLADLDRLYEQLRGAGVDVVSSSGAPGAGAAVEPSRMGGLGAQPARSMSTS